jgi:hypothetical protein
MLGDSAWLGACVIKQSCRHAIDYICRSRGVAFEEGT